MLSNRHLHESVRVERGDLPESLSVKTILDLMDLDGDDIDTMDAYGKPRASARGLRQDFWEEIKHAIETGRLKTENNCYSAVSVKVINRDAFRAFLMELNREVPGVWPLPSCRLSDWFRDAEKPKAKTSPVRKRDRRSAARRDLLAPTIRRLFRAGASDPDIIEEIRRAFGTDVPRKTLQRWRRELGLTR